MRARFVNLGCGPHLPAGWLNVDVSDQVGAELVADVLDGLPIESGTAHRVYLGHVLEHVPWDQVPAFLEECRRLLIPGGLVMVVGPDVERVVRSFAAGLEPWELVESTWESDQVHMTDGEPWEEARHAWNSTEPRVERAMTAAGFVLVRSYTDRLETMRGDGWPLVSGVSWQMGTLYRKGT